MIYILRYLVTFGIFFAIDMVWLGVVARNFYKNQIGHLMASTVNWMAALSFYLLFIAGLLVFVIGPELVGGSLKSVIWKGAFFGLVTYATYDLTNMATLRDWPTLVTVVDLMWGMVLSASVSALSYMVIQRIGL